MFNQTAEDQHPVNQPEVLEEGSLQANTVQHKRIARIVILAASLCTALIIVVTGVIVAPHREAIPKPIEPPTTLLPGNSLPDDSHCDYHPFMDSRIYCSTTQHGSTVYMSYDVARHEIMDTVIFTNHMTVGDLILVWGAPTGYTRSGAAVQVYWGNRSAYVFVGTFSPQSRTSFVTYSLEPHEAVAWHGFINPDR